MISKLNFTSDNFKLKTTIIGYYVSDAILKTIKMTVYSKYFTSGVLLRRQAVLINFNHGIFVPCGANTAGGRKFFYAVTKTNTCIPALPKLCT